jgi:hypothetical protein
MLTGITVEPNRRVRCRVKCVVDLRILLLHLVQVFVFINHSRLCYLS